MSTQVNLGPVTAYGLAVKHGYVGTEAEWVAAQEAAREAAEQAAKDADASAKSVAASAAQIETNRQDIVHLKDMTSAEERAGAYAGYHLGFYLDANGDLCQED